MADVKWRIVSAGFGLVKPETVLPSYECTFRDRESIERRIARRGYDPETLTRREQIRTLATELGIPRDISELLGETIDLAFVVLGADYLLATGDSLESLPNSCTAYAFASEGSRDDIGACEWVPSTEEERATLQTTWTRLKGIQLRNLAQSLDDADDLRALDDAAAVHDRSLAGRR